MGRQIFTADADHASERQDQKLAAPAKPKEKPAELKRPA
jgi:hypothetical protein